jgi:hypothetical protein
VISYADRTLILGQTRSGKSELLNLHFSAFRCQRVLVDTKDEWTIAGVEPVEDVAAIDWRAPVIHLRLEPGDIDAVEQLFRLAFEHRGPLVLGVHELADLCDYRPHLAPRHLRRYLAQGAAHGLGLLGASQRPVEMPVRSRTETQHVFVFVPRLAGDDVEAIARMVGLSTRELERELDERQAEDGLHSFLWFDRREGKLTAWPPLTAELRAGSIVDRRPGVS